MVSWKKLDVGIIEKDCLSQYERYGVYPSLRELFYAFVDELWPNTKSAYQGLSRWLRDKRISGEIDWKIIRDGSGREISNGDWVDKTVDTYVGASIVNFKHSYHSFHLPKWLNQPYRVFIICEKDADYPVTKSIVSDLNVDVGFMRGYTGWRLLFEIEELIRTQEAEPIILALGDFDPSGEDIIRFLNEALRKTLEIRMKEPIKLTVLNEQIERFKLPHKPEDQAEIKKLKSDPRFKKWHYGLYRVETAALRKKQPDFFDNLLRENVLKYFDESIYKEAKQIEDEKRNEVKERIEILVKKMEER